MGEGRLPAAPSPSQARPGFQDLGMSVCPNPLKSPSSFEAAAKVWCWLYPRTALRTVHVHRVLPSLPGSQVGMPD